MQRAAAAAASIEAGKVSSGEAWRENYSSRRPWARGEEVPGALQPPQLSEPCRGRAGRLSRRASLVSRDSGREALARRARRSRGCRAAAAARTAPRARLGGAAAQRVPLGQPPMRQPASLPPLPCLCCTRSAEARRKAPLARPRLCPTGSPPAAAAATHGAAAPRGATPPPALLPHQQRLGGELKAPAGRCSPHLPGGAAGPLQSRQLGVANACIWQPLECTHRHARPRSAHTHTHTHTAHPGDACLDARRIASRPSPPERLLLQSCADGPSPEPFAKGASPGGGKQPAGVGGGRRGQQGGRKRRRRRLCPGEGGCLRALGKAVQALEGGGSQGEATVDRPTGRPAGFLLG